jgi:DNA-binding IscR family transcriptional regulator
VLRVMSEHGDEWVTKAQIREASKLKESTLNNALSALRSKHIIIDKRGIKGVYKLPTNAFAVWIKGITTVRDEPQQPD